MLIDEPMVLRPDPILLFMADGFAGERLETGCYRIGHFGCSGFLDGYDDYPELSLGPYGVCDSLEQLKQRVPELHDPSRKFVVTLTEVRKCDQPESGGWRWHKWGEYIGDHEIQREYLYHEPVIERVFCFQIYEKVEK
jgi:hypothetical protein